MLRSRVSYEEARARILAKGSPAALETLGFPALPDIAATWELSLQWWTTTPGPRSSGSPFPWSRFGGEDPITPVAESIAVLREAVRPNLLRVEVFPGADHRLHLGDRLAWPTVSDDAGRLRPPRSSLRAMTGG